MKKVLYVGGFIFPYESAATTRVKNIGRLLKSINYVTQYFSIYFGCDEANYNASLQKKSYWEQISFKKLERYIYTYQPDVIIAYNLPSILFIKLLLNKKKFNYELIIDCTEWYDTKGISLFKKPIKWLDTSLRMNFLNFLSKKIICISSRLEKKYSKKKTILIPPLMDDTYKIQNKRKPYVLVFSGNGASGKDDLEAIINAINNLVKKGYIIKLEIIGIEAEQMSINCSDKTWLKFHGRLARNEARKVISMSHYSVFFRKGTRANNYGFPTKLSESIALGVPVITNDFSDISYYITNSVDSFYTKKMDDNALERIIEKALELDSYQYDMLVRNMRKLDFFKEEKYRDEFFEFMK